MCFACASQIAALVLKPPTPKAQAPMSHAEAAAAAHTEEQSKKDKIATAFDGVMTESNRGLETLFRFQTLRQVNVEGTGVTKRGLESFSYTAPSCVLFHDKYQDPNHTETSNHRGAPGR